MYLIVLYFVKRIDMTAVMKCVKQYMIIIIIIIYNLIYS